MVLDPARAVKLSGPTPVASAAPAASWMKLRLFMVSSLKHCLVAAALFALPEFLLVLWACAVLRASPGSLIRRSHHHTSICSQVRGKLSSDPSVRAVALV